MAMKLGKLTPACRISTKFSPARTRARILEHLLEAEKSTFRGELSFQRSECTAGLTVATTFCVVF